MPLVIDTGDAKSAAALNSSHCVSVGLINNMPDAALESTERQFTELLRAATPNAAVVLKLFVVPQVPRSPAARRNLAERYNDIAALWDTPLDGLIVTGTEPRAAKLSDEPFWDTMSALVDWARDHTASTIWSCLAAHVAVLHADGIERQPLPQKRCGVFECRLAADHPLTQHFPETLLVPHSRHNDLPEPALAAAGYSILTRSAAAGIDTFARQDGSFFLFFQGHPEYEPDTLLREYRRDVSRFIAGERSHYPAVPQGYFDAAALARMEAFAARVRGERRPELMAEFPKEALGLGLDSPWRRAAVGIYRKWADYLVARKAERRLPGVRLRRTWRDWPAALRDAADNPAG